LALSEALLLPAGYNPRTLAWARALHTEPRHAQADASALVAAVMDHVRSEGFTYTLAPGPYGRDAIDEFWFERKLGFCEHFATAFVVVMRAMDIPARVVTGYQGTDPTPIDGYHVVRQSHAHAWAEYWQPGRGWVRADPTAAVAPERIVRSLSLEPTRNLVEGALRSVNPQLVLRLRAALEAVNNQWNQWVLSYSRRQQFDLLRSLGIRSPDWTDLGLALIVLISAASIAGAIWAWLDRHRQDPWSRLFARIRRALNKLDVPAAIHHPPQTLAAMVRTRLGPTGSRLADELERLDLERYGRAARRRPDPNWWPRFRSAASQIMRS
jgi:hypothetical protein